MNDSYRLSMFQRKSKRCPWGIYFFLFVVFYFAQPMDIFYSIPATHSVEQDLYGQIEKIKSGSLGRRIALLSLSCFAMVSLLRRRRNLLQVNGALGVLILFFLFWVFLSIVWADDLSLTMRRVLVLGILSIGALAVAERFSIHNVIMFVFFSGLFGLLLGLSCEIVLGTFQPIKEGYRFSGVMNANFIGWSCATLIIATIALHQKKTCTFIRVNYIIIALFGMFFLLLTRSRGSLAGAMVGILTYFSVTSSKLSKMIWIYATVIVALLIYFIIGNEISNYSKSAFLLGRIEDPLTLTGRLPFWGETLLPYIMERPIGGYGYDSFWTARHLQMTVPKRGWYFPDAHSTIIDISLGLGVVGVAIYLLILILGVKYSIKYYYYSANPDYAFVTAIVVCSFLNSLLSSVQLSPYLPSFFYLILLAKLAFCDSPLSDHVSCQGRK